VRWQFVDSDEDGQAWLQFPDQLHAIVEFQGVDRGLGNARFRLVVVTKRWVELSISGLTSVSGRTVFSAMMVLSDLAPDGLVAAIDAAVGAGGLEQFASRVDA
jgi:hypothetical protein